MAAIRSALGSFCVQAWPGKGSVNDHQRESPNRHTGVLRGLDDESDPRRLLRVPNPFNRNQISRISLLPSDVEVIVFWTRNPKPLMRYLTRWTRSGFVLLPVHHPWLSTGNRSEMPTARCSDTGFQSFRTMLAQPRRLAFDPIVFSEKTRDFHKRRFAEIAGEWLDTNRAVVSVVDDYRKAEPRMKPEALFGLPKVRSRGVRSHER